MATRAEDVARTGPAVRAYRGVDEGGVGKRTCVQGVAYPAVARAQLQVADGAHLLQEILFRHAPARRYAGKEADAVCAAEGRRAVEAGNGLEEVLAGKLVVQAAKVAEQPALGVAAVVAYLGIDGALVENAEGVGGVAGAAAPQVEVVELLGRLAEQEGEMVVRAQVPVVRGRVLNQVAGRVVRVAAGPGILGGVLRRPENGGAELVVLVELQVGPDAAAQAQAGYGLQLRVERGGDAVAVVLVGRPQRFRHRIFLAKVVVRRAAELVKPAAGVVHRQERGGLDSQLDGTAEFVVVAI